MVDFSVPAELQAVRDRVRRFVEEVVVPEEPRAGDAPARRALVAYLQDKAREAGLWNPSLPPEWGGMGLGAFGYALVTYELGRSPIAPLALNCHAPDEPTMQMLLQHGTPEQKEEFLRPLAGGRAHVCFAMTEKAAGADATGMQTRAVRDGDNWVITGEKWFASGAGWADFAVVMAKTNPDSPRRERYSMFLIKLPAPGFRVVRLIATMASDGRHETAGGHGEIEIKDLLVPHSRMLGPQGEGFALGQFRLGWGRLAHSMRNIGLAQRALDIATARALERSTFGAPLSERQAVLWMLADCATELYVSRLMVMHIAYLVEQGIDFVQENSIAKVYVSDMVNKVVDQAIQICGSLGYSKDLPLESWFRHVRAQKIVDGPNEIHKWRVGRNVVKAFKEHGTTRTACGEFV
jgi:acyl-CoA dehydrogenase